MHYLAIRVPWLGGAKQGTLRPLYVMAVGTKNSVPCITLVADHGEGSQEHRRRRGSDIHGHAGQLTTVLVSCAGCDETQRSAIYKYIDRRSPSNWITAGTRRTGVTVGTGSAGLDG